MASRARASKSWLSGDRFFRGPPRCPQPIPGPIPSDRTIPTGTLPVVEVLPRGSPLRAEPSGLVFPRHRLLRVVSCFPRGARRAGREGRGSHSQNENRRTSPLATSPISESSPPPAGHCFGRGREQPVDETGVLIAPLLEDSPAPGPVALPHPRSPSHRVDTLAGMFGAFRIHPVDGDRRVLAVAQPRPDGRVRVKSAASAGTFWRFKRETVGVSNQVVLG